MRGLEAVTWYSGFPKLPVGGFLRIWVIEKTEPLFQDQYSSNSIIDAADRHFTFLYASFSRSKKRRNPSGPCSYRCALMAIATAARGVGASYDGMEADDIFPVRDDHPLETQFLSVNTSVSSICWHVRGAVDLPGIDHQRAGPACMAARTAAD